MNAIKSGVEIMHIIKKLDKNGDGKITEEDFCLATREIGLGSVGDFLAKQVFREVDTNHNGKLDLQEALGLAEKLSHLLKLNQHQGNVSN